MNILICSVGNRVQLINYFKEELNKIEGIVVAVGFDPTAPALYHADFFEVVPRIDHPEYIPCIKHLCRKYKIKGILPLIDSELILLSRYKEEFEKDGICVIVSDKKVIDLCNNKYKTVKFLQENNFPAVPTYIDFGRVLHALNVGELEFPLIVKPIDGNGGIGVQKVTNLHELQVYWKENQNLIVQPFIDGIEFCVECYIDLLTMETTNLFSKRKITMRGGETDKSISIKDCKLNGLTIDLVRVLNPMGPIDIDFYNTKDGYIISEINPRFGGGYPYAHQMGQNFIKSIINNLNGIPNRSYEKYWGDYKEGKTMARFDQYIIL